MVDNIAVKNLSGSRVEISATLPFSDLQIHKERSLKELGKDITVSGFRKGHIPEHILVQKIGAFPLLEKMAEYALSEAYPKILQDKKIEAIGAPKIQITKLAEGNPFSFTATTAVMPDITLPDYKALAQKTKKPAENTDISDKELDSVLLELRKQKAFENLKKANIDPQTTNLEDNLPPLDDAFAQEVGKAKTVSELKDKIREGMKREKKMQEYNKYRVALLEKIVDKSTIDVPEILLESELTKMTDEMKARIQQMGLTYDAYLTHIKKTEDDLKTEWKKDAEKRVKFGLVLGYIARTEKISLDKEEVEKEVEKMQEVYKDAPRDRLRHYIEGHLMNEKVYQLLENQ